MIITRELRLWGNFFLLWFLVFKFLTWSIYYFIIGGREGVRANNPATIFNSSMARSLLLVSGGLQSPFQLFQPINPVPSLNVLSTLFPPGKFYKRCAATLWIKPAVKTVHLLCLCWQVSHTQNASESPCPGKQGNLNQNYDTTYNSFPYPNTCSYITNLKINELGKSSDTHSVLPPPSNAYTSQWTQWEISF